MITLVQIIKISYACILEADVVQLTTVNTNLVVTKVDTNLAYIIGCYNLYICVVIGEKYKSPLDI